MYIRRVRVPSGSRKSQNIYYNLVESVRTPKGSHQRIVLSLGKLDIEMDAGDKMELIREDSARGVRIEIRGKDVANERYILVKSEMKRRKEESMASRSKSLFIERLQYWHDGLDKPRRLKTYESILRAPLKNPV